MIGLNAAEKVFLALAGHRSAYGLWRPDKVAGAVACKSGLAGRRGRQSVVRFVLDLRLY